MARPDPSSSADHRAITRRLPAPTVQRACGRGGGLARDPPGRRPIRRDGVIVVGVRLRTSARTPPRAVAEWAVRRSGSDPVRAHHLVVLVLDDVAVPDEQPGAVVGRLDAGDLAGVGDDGVLASGLPRLGPANLAALDALAVDDLEGDLV